MWEGISEWIERFVLGLLGLAFVVILLYLIFRAVGM
jgi:hypothetical protein